jgi:hypothetical protein
MYAIEPAVRCPTLFLGDRPMALSNSAECARCAHAVRTLLGVRRLRRGPESDPRRKRAHSCSCLGAGHWRVSRSGLESQIAFGRPLTCHSAARRGPRVIECRGRANKLYCFYLFTMWTIRVPILEAAATDKDPLSS